MSRHKWNNEHGIYGSIIVCGKCGCVKKWASGKPTYFINDSIYHSAPDCQPANNQSPEPSTERRNDAPSEFNKLSSKKEKPFRIQQDRFRPGLINLIEVRQVQFLKDNEAKIWLQKEETEVIPNCNEGRFDSNEMKVDTNKYARIDPEESTLIVRADQIVFLNIDKIKEQCQNNH